MPLLGLLLQVPTSLGAIPRSNNYVAMLKPLFIVSVFADWSAAQDDFGFLQTILTHISNNLKTNLRGLIISSNKVYKPTIYDFY